MAVPTQTTQQPYSSLTDGLTSVDAVDGFVDAHISLHLTGTVSQVQADWATLAAVSLSSPSALMAAEES